jgi:hypothetical protein
MNKGRHNASLKIPYSHLMGPILAFCDGGREKRRKRVLDSFYLR